MVRANRLMDESTPLTVIGGFLGSGKTTLLNHVLRHATGRRYAVLVNDFGEIAIDDRLIIEHGGDTVSFANGCVCCSLGDNLLDTVDRLLGAPNPPEQFLVEASGVSDPTAIADLATLHPDLRRDLIVIVCDGTTIRARAADARLADTVERQLGAADVLVMNHGDRLDEAEREKTRAWLVERTGRRVVATDHARVDLDILDAGLDPAQGQAGPEHRHATGAHPFHSRVIHADAPRDPSTLPERLRALGPSLVRAKGLLRDPGQPQRWWLVQKAGDYVELTSVPANAMGGDSALVLLSLDPLPGAADLAIHLGLTERPGSHPPKEHSDADH